MEAPMSQPAKVHIGEKVGLDKIESAFRQFWRDSAGGDGSEAVLKASTHNLIIYVDEKQKYDELLDGIHEIISHHPGRMIIAFLDPQSEADDVEAHVSAYTKQTKEGLTQISAELVFLKTGIPGSVHLEGAILPLLLPDLPVYFWCTSICALQNQNFDTLLNYTDRLIVSTPDDYESIDELQVAIERILTLDRECNISDISWSALTSWREAVAQFFDSAANAKYLGRLDEVEVTYSGDKLSNKAFLMAGWLSSQLGNIPHTPSLEDGSTIYFKRQSGQLPVKIRKKNIAGVNGLYKIKLFADDHEKSVFFTATAVEGKHIQATVQKGGDLLSNIDVPLAINSKIELLCNELDFLQKDEIYLSACKRINEYLNEK
jgi:glucose-6-phosphate dehydrogenase assembly protein OpcA